MEQTTPNIGGPTMMGVVASVLAVMCKRMQRLLTMLGPAGHRWKDTTHNTLEARCNAHAWPQQCWKSSVNGNIVALSFGDQGTKEIWGVVTCWLKSLTGLKRFATSQQHATTSNNTQQGVQMDVCLRFRFFFYWLTWTRDNETRTCVLSLCAEDSVRVLIVDFWTGRNM